jgi:ABC-type antimicrobial peptide transport system permease subunit
MGIFIRIFIATLGIATISSIIPALRVTKMKIVDALGHI